MLAPDAKADDARGNSPQDWEAIEEPQNERHFFKHCLADNERRQDAVVDRLLHALDNPRREHATILHLVEKPFDVLTTG